METELEGIPPTEKAANTTGIIVNEETRIETVIIILWVTGGVLLMALLIMLFCLIKSKHKGNRSVHRRPSLFHIDSSRGYPPGGGVNHGYTSYDEIWTWIPVVRQDQCQSSSRLTRTPSNASTLHREPPPYSVATSGRTPQTSAPPAVHSHAPRQAPPAVSSHTSRQVVSNIVRNDNSLSVLPSTSRGGNSQGFCANNIDTAVALLSSSENSPFSNNINVIPSTNENYHLSRDSQGPSNRRQANNSMRDDVRSPHLSRRHQRNASISHVTANTMHDAQIHSRTQMTGNGSVTNQTHAQDTRQFEYHPEEGVYSYVTGTDGRRAWVDIPPTLLDEDGPPPYAPPPDYPEHRRYYPNNRQNRNRSAPLMRLDYDYF